MTDKEAQAHKEIIKKLDKILKNQEKLLAEEGELLEDERKMLKGEKAIQKAEAKILAQEKALMSEEHAIELALHRKILKKITIHDVYKGIIGSFFGTIGHFAFFEGAHIAEQMSMTRATILYAFAYFVGWMLIYASGFRKVKEKKAFHLIPIRVTVMFVIAILSSVLILLLFNQIKLGMAFSDIYKIVANVCVLAMFGATTADFLGSEN